MADRPRRECRRVRTFLEETAAAQRRAADAKRQRREEEATRQEVLDKAEAPLLAEFERAARVTAQLAEEEALLHETQARESRHRIRADSKSSHAAQQQFLADRLDLLEPFLAPKLVKALRPLQRQSAPDAAALATVPHLTASPPFLAATLRDYQLVGVNWLVTLYDHGCGAILADEMGLGKTLQTIAFIAYLIHVRNACGPYLVVCPLSVLGTWLAECKRWCPALRVLQLYGPAVEREAQRQRLLREHFDVCVTTYEMAVALQNFLANKLFRYVILDEAQRVKCHESKVSQAIRQLPCQHRLLLTGTPLQNNVRELWALLNLLFPAAFPTSEAFDQCFDISNNVVDVAKLQQVRRLLRPIMLRRMKEEVALELPPKVETKVLVPLTPLQKKLYACLVTREIGENGFENLDNIKWTQFVYLLMQLRKCCNHPYMFPEAVPDTEEVGEDVVHTSGKMRVLDRLLLKLQARGSRVLLFSGFTTMLDVIEDYCGLRGFKYLRLDGSRSRIHREVDMGGFQRADSAYFLFLISTRAGGLGLNLPAADTVVLYDSDWNPQVDIQAQARCHRIGQDKPVRVFRLVTEGSAEQRLVQRAEKKLFLDAVVQRPGPDRLGGMAREELLATLRFGWEAIFNTVDQDATDADIEAVVSCSLDGPGQSEAAGAEVPAEAEEETADEAVTGPRPPGGALKRKAADFDVHQELVPITLLDGVELERNAGLKGKEMRDEAEILTCKRPAQPRMVAVSSTFNFPGVKTLVKREDLPILVPAPPPPVKKASKKERPTESECWVCRDGGSLLCCSFCPKVYHEECLRHSYDANKPCWSCPQHNCVVCDKGTSEAGGVIFRCSTCPLCFCYEHHPEDSEILHDGCPRLAALGFQPSSAVFIRCPSCLHETKTGERLLEIDVWARRLEPDYDDDEVEAVLDRRFNRHRSAKSYGINYYLKFRHYGPRHNAWRARPEVPERYHPLLDAFDAQWRADLQEKEQRAAELRAARLARPPAPWDARTKEEKAARRAARLPPPPPKSRKPVPALPSAL